MAPDPASNGQNQADPGTHFSKLEPGTFPVLGFGEEVQFAEVKNGGDYKAFVRAQSFEEIDHGDAGRPAVGGDCRVNESSLGSEPLPLTASLDFRIQALECTAQIASARRLSISREVSAHATTDWAPPFVRSADESR